MKRGEGGVVCAVTERERGKPLVAMCGYMNHEEQQFTITLPCLCVYVSVCARKRDRYSVKQKVERFMPENLHKMGR